MPKRVLSPELPRRGTWVALPESESHHALNVLRLTDGDHVEVLDGNGHQVLAVLRVRKGQAYLEYFDQPIQSSQPTPSPLTSNRFICVEMAILKGDAMEWVIEKAVELGVTQLVPVIAIRSVVQMKTKGPEFFQQRWQKIADQALKQCGRLERMVVSPPTSFEELLAVQLPKGMHRLWCDEARSTETPEILEWLQYHHLQLLEGVRILVGPEGGWDPVERDRLNQLAQTSVNQRISLGPYVLRAETAALFAISLAAALLRKRN